MGVGVSTRSTPTEGTTTPPGQLTPGPLVGAAVAGVTGPALTVLGFGPVTMATGTRPMALLSVAMVAGVTSLWLGRLSRPGPAVSLPVLVILGALATWPTAGRVQGAWCVLATAVAVPATRSLTASSRPATRRVLGLAGLAATAIAGLVWTSSGPGPEAVALLGLAAALGTALARSRAVTTTGDRWLTVARSGLRTLRRAALHWTGRALQQLRRSPAVVAMTEPGSRRATTVAGAATGVVMFPAFLTLVSDTSRTSIFTDYELHMRAAETTRILPFTTLTPHWLFQVLTASLRPVVGLYVGAAIVLAASCGVAVTVLGRRAGRGSDPAVGPTAAAAAAIGTIGFWLDSPTAFLNISGWLSPPRAFAPIHAWGSPTDTLAFPLILLLMIAVVRFVDEEHSTWFRPTPARLTMVALSTATLLTKPNIPMVMLGVVPITILLRHGRSVNRLAASALWLGVPTAAVLVLQLRHMHVSRGISDYDPGGWGVTVDPFAFLDMWPAPQGGVWFWISMPAIWLLGAWVLGRRYWFEPVVGVTQLTLLLSLVPMVLLRETGLHANDGNFMKAGYGAAMVLTALTAVEVGRELWFQYRGVPTWSTEQRRRRVAASAVIGSTYLLGGLSVYLATVAPELTPGSLWPTL